MAYNAFVPATYPGAYYPQGYQQPVQPQAQQQIQNGGIVSVRNRVEAQNYPVAPGNSVTFKDETAPYVYTKTMGYSQLDRPVFEIYRLVKEDNAAETASAENNVDLSGYVTKAEFAAILSRLEALEQEKNEKAAKKKGGEADE